MTDTINEQISAFADGELPDAERELLQRRLTNDAGLQATWQRYHLIRDALRDDLPELISKDNDVAYIQNENASLSQAAIPASLLQRFMKPVAGMAIAASVAALAVVGVLHNSDQLSAPGLPQVADSQATQAVTPEIFTIVPRSSWQSVKPAVVSHLNGYLVDHSSYAGFGSAQGIIPYSRVAGYDEPMPDEELKENANKKNNNQQ